MIVRKGLGVTMSLLIAAVLLLVSQGCDSGEFTPGSQDFVVEGDFQTCPMDSIRLYYIDGFQLSQVESAAISKEGSEARFAMSGTLPSAGFYLIGKGPNNVLPIVLGTEKKVKLSGNCSDLRKNGKIENSSANESFKDLSKRFYGLIQKGNFANQKISMGRQTQNQGLLETGATELKDIYAEQLKMLDSLRLADPFMALVFAATVSAPFDEEDNPKGYANNLDQYVGEFFAEVDLTDPTLNYIPTVSELAMNLVSALFSGQIPQEEAEAKLDEVLARLPEGSLFKKNFLANSVNALDRMQSTSFSRYARRAMDEYSHGTGVIQGLNGRIAFYEQKAEADKALALGAIPPEIALPTPDGKILKLSDMKGKVVLIDFWASWCKPCRQENPNIVAAYHEFKSRGFDILGVSLDRSRDAWLRAIEKDGLVWPQVSDLKFWQSKAARAYNVSSIPASFLLDREGKIIGKNLRGPALRAKLNEVLGG